MVAAAAAAHRRVLPLLLLLCVMREAQAQESEASPSLLMCMVFGSMCEFSAINVILALFFLAWNFMLSGVILGPVVRMLVFGFKDGCAHFNLVMCIFPHWYLGILAPLYLGGLLSASVAVGIPYSFRFFTMLDLALKEKKHEFGGEATRLKMDAAEAISKCLDAVSSSNHPDDVVLAVEEHLGQLHFINLPDGESILRKVVDGWNRTLLAPSLSVLPGGDLESPADDIALRASSAKSIEDASLKRSASARTIGKLTKTVSGQSYFSTGVPNNKSDNDNNTNNVASRE
eukprot:TRINITY_DN18594_c0_g1_i1.p1 TRINITY_DN18594_c0_g1~~TRINITY_DN18594_c0_g1_i1.p1  ORF type:complete len:287 (+),score=47.92 TRINITY_DN18594_c0_g1_i1:108-968(+)